MHLRTAVMNVLPIFGAAVVACMLPAGGVGAKEVTVTYQVSAKGLDLRQPAGVREFYGRVKRAAVLVCTHGNRVDLQPPADPAGCYEKALGDAIRSANMSRLTQLYLETHTLQAAAAHGIDVTVYMAAK